MLDSAASHFLHPTAAKWCQGVNPPSAEEVYERMQVAGCTRSLRSVYLGLLAGFLELRGYSRAEVREALSGAAPLDPEPPHWISKGELRNFLRAAGDLLDKEAKLNAKAAMCAERVFRELGPAGDRAHRLIERAVRDGRDPREDPEWLRAQAEAIELRVRWRQAMGRGASGVRQRLEERRDSHGSGPGRHVVEDSEHLAEAEWFKRRAAELPPVPAETTKQRRRRETAESLAASQR